MRVPEPGAPTVGLSSAPTPMQNIQATPEELGGGFGAGLAKMGEAGQAAGQELASSALRFQEMTNQALGDERMTTFLNGMADLGHGPNGFYTKQGKDAMDALPEYRQNLNDLRQHLEDTSPNMMVKLQFEQDSRRMFGYQMLDAAQHADTQRLKWFDSTDRGVITSAANDAVVNYGDPQRLAAAEALTISRIAAIDARNGVSPEEGLADTQKAVSGLYTDVIKRTMQDDPWKAQRMFYANAGKFTAADADALARTFHSTIRPMEYQNAADGVMSGAQKVTDAETMFSKGIIAAENTGTGVTSVAGAMGRGQITEAAGRQAATELGLPYDKDKLLHDDEYNHKLGVQYTQDMLSHFRGNPAMAAAAYNWGAERVNDLVKKIGDPSLGQIPMEQFIAALPDGRRPDGTVNQLNNVQGYVRKVLSKIGGVDIGVQATSGDIRDHLADFLAAGVQTARTLFLNDPDAEVAIDRRIRSQVDMVASGQDALERAAHNAVFQAVTGGPMGTGPRISTLPDLFRVPGALENWQNMTPEQRQNIQNLMAKPIGWTQASAATYKMLRGMAQNEPEEFVKQDIVGAGVPTSKISELIGLQEKLKNKPEPNPRIRQMLGTAELFGAPSKTNDPDGYRQFAGALLDEARVFALVHNREPNDNDVRDLTGMLLMKHSSGLFGSTLNYQTGYAAGTEHIAPQEVRQIGEAFQRRWGRAPNAGEVRYWFDRLHGAANVGR